MKNSFRLLFLAVSLTASGLANVARSQASCASPGTLANGCNTQANIQNAVGTAPSVSCISPTTTFGVYYSFTPTSSNGSMVFSLSNPTVLSATTTYVQLFSGTCASPTMIACQNISSPLNFSGLSTSTTYTIRISAADVTSGGGSTKRKIDICLYYAPSNDDCTNAVTLTSSTTCNTYSGDLAVSSASSPAITSPCSGTPGGDIWYKFVAQTPFPTIALSSIGSTLQANTANIQLFSGVCGTLTSLGCSSGTSGSLNFQVSSIVGGSGLTTGNTYYVRVYTNTTSTSGSGFDFGICITDPAAGSFDYSRSYINVSKGSAGGTVNPGDTLEMRATFVVTAQTADSLSFTDTLYNTRGLRLVPGSIALRTNEGKIYKQFTDLDTDTDAGWYETSGLDTIIKINIGPYASRTRRGSLTNTSRPSVYTSTCIVMATYRVVVYAPYNTMINFRSGVLTFRDAATGTYTATSFVRDSLIVYSSPGLCPNAVSATNALGAESNGTFGKPSGSAPLARNRGTSPYTTYSYKPFTASGGPNDYYYGIANNTSSKFTTATTAPKPDGNGYRVFNLWDITGDHTNSTNTAKGNLPCDTTKPISATNPCGYMLVINSAYRADTAFTYTVNNLCPNTYYELSAWFKNICYKCGCDSTGAGSNNTGYIPSAPGDSSGVQPNIAFDVNGKDYYTTGNIPYVGTTPTGSDSTNIWVKKGFVYLTGPSETSFTLTLRNNAPGGGGNDWALDDISVATCLPNMSYSPSLTPNSCMGNVLTINDTVRTYFSNYTYYKWQRSTDGGSNWSDISGSAGNASTTAISTGYQFITSYTIPTTQTTVANNNDKYRVVVATTNSNLSNTNCQFTDGISIITLQVTDCGAVLDSRLLAFDAKADKSSAFLTWSATEDQEQVWFDVERSYDGNRFEKIGTIKGNNTAGINFYSMMDSVGVKGQTSYRVSMYNSIGQRKFSRIIVLNAGQLPFEVQKVSNPFKQSLRFDVSSPATGRVEVRLLDLSGKALAQAFMQTHPGINSMSIDHLDHLAAGMYVLQVVSGEQTINYKVIKQ